MKKFEKTKGERKSMQNKQNTKAKVIVVAIAILLCLALAVGITGAFYQARRRATGTVKMDKGIVIDYTGFGKDTDGIWVRENETSFRLFSDTDVQPGEKISLNDAGIRANASSVDFYARVKLSYEFYNGETPVELADATKLIKTSSSFFGTNWVESGDGYFYYAADSTLNKFAKTATTFVDLFATDAQFIIEGAGFTGAENEGEGGGYVVDETTSINKIVVYLTLETLQGDATPEQAKALGWEITEKPIIENFSENKLLNSAGDEIDINSTDLVENAIYQVVDESGNGYKFTYALNEENKTATITGYVGSPTTLVIPNIINVNNQEYTVTTIGNSAFLYCKIIKSLILPSSVTTLGNSAFSGSSFESISIPSSLERIDYNALPSNVVSNPSATEGNIVYLGNATNKYVLALKVTDKKLTNYSIKEGCTVIGDNAFDGCNSAVSIDLPNTLKSTSNCSFRDCTSLTSITLPNSLIKLGTSSFAYCTNLENISLPESLQLIEGGVFTGCENLNSTIEGGVEYLGNDSNKYMLAWKASDKTLTSYVIKSGCKFIDDGSFSDCSEAETMVLPNGLINIGSNAFQNCTKLTSIEIPHGVISIGRSAFSGCTVLSSASLPSTLKNIGSSAFQNCTSLSSIVIPEGVQSLPSSTFSGCSNLITVSIPSSLIYCADDFSNCNKLQPSITENGIAYLGNESNPYVVAWKTTDKTQTSYSIKEGCMAIGQYAFQNCNKATSFTISNSVKSMVNYSFSGCTEVTSITFGSGLINTWIDGSKIVLRAEMFGSMKKLETITVAEGNMAYYSEGNCLIEAETKTLILGCKNSIIPSDGNVTSIGESAFSACKELTTIEIPNSVTIINKYAFSGCQNLTSIIIPESITTIGYSAFSNCNNLATVIIDSSTIAALTSSNSSYLYLLTNAATVYVKTGLTVGSYITGSFTKQGSSDKAGYDMYTHN